MAGNTNNNIELLVGIRADTDSSKAGLQSQLNQLAKELDKIPVQIELDKDSKKALDDISKIDLSRLQSQVDGLNKSLGKAGEALGDGVGDALKKTKKGTEEVATTTRENFTKAWERIEQVMKTSMDDTVKKGFTSAEQLKKAFNTIDSSIKIDIDANAAMEEMKAVRARIEKDGITQVVEFKPAKMMVDDKTTMDVWMPDVIKETTRSVNEANTAVQRYSEQIRKLQRDGKITDDQFEALSRTLKEINTPEGLANLDDNLRKANIQMDDMVAETKKLNNEKREQLQLENKIADLQAKMVAMDRSRPKVSQREDYQSLANDIKAANAEQIKSASTVNDLTNRYKMLNAETKEVGRSQIGVMESFRIAMEKFPVWMAASTIFFGTVRTAREFATIIVDIDTKMTDLAKVMSEDTDLGEVFDRATASAEKFGQTISQTLDAYTEFARQGFQGADLGYLADAAIAAGNVGDIETGKAAEYMTASLIQWKKESKDAMNVIDQWNAVSNNYATTVENLAQGQARAGATARAMGLDFEETNSLIALLTASTKQSGNEIGNFLKSVLPRLTSKPAQKAMESLGVNLTDNQGNLRNIIDVYTEIAQKVQNISDAERIAVTEGLAGKYHISRMQALLDDLASADSMYAGIEETARNAAGSAMQENEKYLESLEARMAMARIEIEKLALAIGDAFLTEGMIQFLKASGDLLGTITQLVTKFGALPGILGIIGASVFAMSGRFRGLIGSVASAAGALVGFNTAARATSTTTTAAAAGTDLLAKATKRLVASTVVGAAFVALGYALEAIIGKMGEAREEAERLESEQKVMAESYKANAESIEALTAEYAELESQMNSGTIDTQGKERLAQIHQELAQHYPSMITGEDEHGRSMVANSSVIEAQNTLLREQLRIERELNDERAAEDRAAKIEEANEKLKAANEEQKQHLEYLNNALKYAPEVMGMDDMPDFRVSGLEDALQQLKAFTQMRDQAIADGKQKEADYYGYLIELINTNSANLTKAHQKEISAMNSLQQTYLQEASIYIASRENMTAASRNFSNSIAAQMVQVADSSEELEKINGIIEGIDFTPALESQLSKAEKVVKNFADSTKENFEQNRDEVNEVYDDLLQTLVEAGNIEVGSAEYDLVADSLERQRQKALEAGDAIRDYASANSISYEEARNALIANGDLADGYDNVASSAEGAKDAIDIFSGVTEEQITTADDLVWQYEILTAQLGQLDEGTREHAQTQEMLNGVKGQLLDLYPHLFDAQTTAENLTYEQIEAIQQEILAQDTLRAAIKASRDGKLTAEQNQTLASWQGTRARINNINEEIRALSILAQHYNSIQSGMAAARAAATAFAPGAFGTVMNAGFTAQMKQFEYLNTRYETATANLQKDLALEKSYIDTMRTSQEVLDRGTSKANKNAAAQKKASDATKKGSKAKKDNAKASKEQQKAIEETNETIREAIYLANTYAQAMENLALAIKKEQDNRSKYSQHSKQYRESLMREIELQKQQYDLMKAQTSEYQKQIDKGVIIKRGEIVTTEYQKTTSTAPARTVKPSGFGGRITSGYGYRTHPVTGQRGSFHAGIDVASPKGTRLDSPVDGRVTSAVRNHATLGNYVVVTDSSGMKHMMGHLNSIAVKVGQQIMAGMQVGAIGETGRATGPHLHYEVRNSGHKAVNPTPYLNRARAGVKSGGGQVTVVNPVQKKSISEEVAQSQQDVDNLKSELVSLNGELVDVAATIRQLEIEVVNSQLAEFDSIRQRYQRTIDYEQEKIKGLDITSERYLKTLDIYIREMNNKQNVNQQELNYLNDMIKNGGLTAQTTDELRVRVQELTTEMMALNNEIQQVSFDKITASMRKFEEALSELDYQLSLSEGKLSAFEEGTGDYNKELANQISLMKQRSDEIMRQRYALERLILSENINIEQIKELKQQIQALNLEYWSLQGSIKSTEEALADAQKKLANEVADRLIESYKQVIQQRQEAHMRALDREMDAEDKRHKQVMDNYKKELDSFNKIVQAKIDAIDKEEDERSYNKEIDELEEQRNKLADQLNLLRLDDSFEAKAQRKDLQEQISDIDETIAEKRHQREVSMRKEALGEMLEDKREEISQQEEAENARHERERERIDKQREYWGQYYNDLLNDERKFAEIREQIMAGNFDAIETMFGEMLQEMIDTMPELENSMDGTMEAVGTSIRQNIIDNLREALQLLSELGGKQAVGSNPQTKLLSTADLQVLTGKFITENLAEQFDDDLARQANVRKKGYDLAAQGRAAGSTIPKDVGYDAYLSRLTPEQQEQLRQFIGAQSGMYLTPKYNEALENYGKGQRFSAADYKVLTGKFMVDKATGAAKNASERNVILNRGRTWGQQGRAQGSKLDQYASFDQLINSMDNQELTEFANYLKGSNLFSEYYLKSFVDDYVKRILATATQFDEGGYTGTWGKSGKLSILHEKEYVLNPRQTEGFLNFTDMISRLMPNIANTARLNTAPSFATSGEGGFGDIHIEFNIDKMNGDQNDVRKFSKMFSDEMRRMKGWK